MSYIGNNELFNQVRCFSIKIPRICNHGLKHIEYPSYREEQYKCIKLAPRLVAKACWPTSLERQNVNLALRIFDESTSSATVTSNCSISNKVKNFNSEVAYRSRDKIRDCKIKELNPTTTIDRDIPVKKHKSSNI